MRQFTAPPAAAEATAKAADSILIFILSHCDLGSPLQVSLIRELLRQQLVTFSERRGEAGGRRGGTNQQQLRRHNSSGMMEGGDAGRLAIEQDNNGNDYDNDEDVDGFQHVTFGGGIDATGGDNRIGIEDGEKHSADQQRGKHGTTSPSVVAVRGRDGAGKEWSGRRGTGGDVGRGKKERGEEEDLLGGVEVSTVDGFQGREKEVRDEDFFKGEDSCL